MTCLLVLSIAVACWPAFPAQDQQDAPPAKQQSGDAQDDQMKQQDDSGGILGGPEVKETDSAQADPRFGGGRGSDRSANVPLDRWLRVIGAVSLTLDQKVKIETIVSAYRQAQREHADQFGQEQRQLQQEARRLRAEGRDVPTDVVQRLQRIRSAAPRVQEYQERIWNVLTLEQADEARQQLALVREQIARRRQQQQQRRRAMDAARGDEDAMMDMMAEGEISRRDRADDLRAAEDDPVEFNWETAGLDEASQRRLAFLLKHQAASHRAGDAGRSIGIERHRVP